MSNFKLAMIGVVSILIVLLASMGLRFYSVYVTRMVYTNSYQYSEGLKDRINTMRASLAEIEARLSNPDLDPTTRNNLEAQRSALRIQLNAALSKSH